KAMQMIAASKLKKAQNATLSSRPYVEKLVRLSRELSKAKDQLAHPYLESQGNSGKKLLVVISPDKGLCGGLVTNIVREFFSKKDQGNYIFLNIGKKTEQYVVRVGENLVASFPFGTSIPGFEAVFPIL